MPVLPGDVMLDTNMDFDSIMKSGSMLGSGAVIVMDDSTCMVKAALRIAEFYDHESCGQCTPCREGTGWIRRVLQRIEYGGAVKEDLEKLKTIAKNIEGRTICAFGEAAAWPVLGFLRHFFDEFEAHVNNNGCIFD